MSKDEKPKNDPIGDAIFRRETRREKSQTMQGGVRADGNYFDESVCDEIRFAAAKWGASMSDYAHMAVLVPTGIWSFSAFADFPDLDISTLGIGNHRFFLFHSAAAVWLLKKIYDARLERSSGSTSVTDKVIDKIVGVVGATGAYGVGVHLAIDVFQPKSVVFPFLGSLVDGTLVDDNIWLLANSVYCFKLGNKMMALALGPDLPRVKNFVQKTILEPVKEGIVDVIPGRS